MTVDEQIAQLRKEIGEKNRTIILRAIERNEARTQRDEAMRALTEIAPAKAFELATKFDEQSRQKGTDYVEA